MPDLTPSETRVIFIISVIIIISGILQYYGNPYSKQANIDYSKADSVFSRLSHQKGNKDKQYDYLNDENKKATTRDVNNRESSHTRFSKPININTADENDLKKLPRIGPAMAKRIIEFRLINGPYNSVDELKKVKGIGEKTFNKIKPYLEPIP